jgi:hypothetical protein
MSASFIDSRHRVGQPIPADVRSVSTGILSLSSTESTDSEEDLNAVLSAPPETSVLEGLRGCYQGVKILAKLFAAKSLRFYVIYHKWILVTIGICWGYYIGDTWKKGFPGLKDDPMFNPRSANNISVLKIPMERQDQTRYNHSLSEDVISWSTTAMLLCLPGDACEFFYEFVAEGILGAYLIKSEILI